VPLRVHLRPNAPYLVMMAIALGGAAAGVSWGGLAGVVVLVSSGAFLALLGVPVAASTVLRVPVVAINELGIRLPMMRIRLAWSDVLSVQRPLTADGPLLLIIPEEPAEVIDQAWPWLRRELRDNYGRHGGPIVIRDKSLSRSCEQILAAVRLCQPKRTS
jgi:hypothetical protein